MRGWMRSNKRRSAGLARPSWFALSDPQRCLDSLSSQSSGVKCSVTSSSRLCASRVRQLRRRSLGYSSKEIGDELGDDLYLNHMGVNRQFILLTTEQKTAPLLNAKFSTSTDRTRIWRLK